LSAKLTALVRRCDICGIVNACDLDASPERWNELQKQDHTVFRMTEAEAMEHWKDAGKCDHSKLIADMKARIAELENAR